MTQFTHTELPLEDHVPALQEKHAEDDVAELKVDQKPETHLIHDEMEVAASTELHVPATQPVHVADPPVDHVPELHDLQLEEEVAENDVDHRPAVQLMHELAEVAAITEHHVPVAHEVQNVEKVDDQVPRVHWMH
jgi:hypothetical protein